MKKFTSRRFSSIFMLGGVAAMMGATMMVPRTAQADKAQNLKYGAAALGILGAVLAVKGNTLPAIIAGAGAYYAYEQGKDAQNDQRYDDRYNDNRWNNDRNSRNNNPYDRNNNRYDRNDNRYGSSSDYGTWNSSNRNDRDSTYGSNDNRYNRNDNSYYPNDNYDYRNDSNYNQNNRNDTRDNGYGRPYSVR